MSVQQLEREHLSTFYSQPVQEHASRILETHRVPDPYYFEVDKDGDLFSPSARLKVKKIIDTSSQTGVLEAAACEVISKWVSSADSGAIAWLSPPEVGVYPVSKIIISEIENDIGRKRLLNRAIVLDIDEKECLALGQRLSGYSVNKPFLTHLDQLRATPIVMDTRNRTWLEIMNLVMPNPALWESVRKGDEWIAKQKALAEAESIITKYAGSTGSISFNTYERDREMKAMLGDKTESCPPKVLSSGGQTAFSVFSSHAMESDSMGSLYFPCPKCRAINKRPREGYVENCQSCGSSAVACN